jgi:hypothetical protein
VCHQDVCGAVLWSTRAGSQCLPLCVPSVCMWCCSLKHKGLNFLSLCVPSGCMWCCSLKHKGWLTIFASLCAIRKYVVLFFEAQGLVHNIYLFVSHQWVCGVVLWTTRAGSQILPLCVPSVGMWCCSLKHKACSQISASLCRVAKYVVFLINPTLLNSVVWPLWQKVWAPLFKLCCHLCLSAVLVAGMCLKHLPYYCFFCKLIDLCLHRRFVVLQSTS